MNPRLTVSFLGGLVALLCISQAIKGIDLKGYLEIIRACSQDSFVSPPYPTLHAANGDYFQTPFTTMLLYPFSFLPLIISKIIFSGFATGLLIFMIRKLRARSLSPLSQFFLIVFFSHALSDVYLALNPLFWCLGLLWICHSYSLSTKRSHQMVSGASLALSIFLRVIPLMLVPFLVFFPERRKTAWYALLFLALGFSSTLLFFPKPFLWWGHWFTSLGLYSEAAELLSPAFQSPAAVISKWATALGASRSTQELLEKGFSLATLSSLFFLSLKAEKLKRKDLAFALLVSGFYISFSRMWASGLLYCLPLVILVLREERSPVFNFLATCYAFLPQWLYPRTLWNGLMSRWALQGLVISGVLVWCLGRASRKLSAHPSGSKALE